MQRLGLVLGLAILSCGAVGPALAETGAVPPSDLAAIEIPQTVTALSAALRISEVMVALRDEGMANAAELAADLPRGGADPLWAQALLRIYDPAHMETVFNQALAESLGQEADTLSAATAFFASGIGQRALSLELAARKALMDDAVEAAAEAAYADLARTDPQRQAQIERFVAVNDLVESNVMGALNANLAFLQGLGESGGPEFALPEADMLAQVWAAEPEVRAEMQGWVYPFLTLAYQPLSDDELQSYIDFSETPAGQRVNAAMFQAYDAVFDQISRDLGRSFGIALQGNDI